MGLTGLQIYKLLPQTNCKECGYLTCLAFAMKLAVQKEELDKCPYASEEAKAALGAASAPPIKLVKIGTGEEQIALGEETVLFRHDKTFFHHPAIGEILPDTMEADSIKSRVKYLKSLDFERAGEVLKVDIVGIDNVSGDAVTFKGAISAVVEAWKRPLALIPANSSSLKAGLNLINSQRPLIVCKSALPEFITIAGIAKEAGCPVMVCGDGTIIGTLQKVAEVRKTGMEDIIINPVSAALAQMLAHQTLLRRTALDRLNPNAAYPTGVIIRKDDIPLFAPAAICKYPAVILLESPSDEIYVSLLTLRQNIYTDPQKPLQVESNIYPVGEPDETSPVVVTTNFALTFFMVSSEIDSAGVNAHLAIVEAEGMSVLTAWSAGKFNAQIIAKSMKEMKLEEKVNHRKLIIPGYVASLQGELEDEMPGWEILVGPQEASDIGDYFKEVLEK